jgi:hypothetical protein
MAKNQTGNSYQADDIAVTKSKQPLRSLADKLLFTLILILFLAAAGTAGYFYKQYQTIKNNPNQVAQDEVKSLIDEVGKLLVLPDNEQPTIATVTDLAKLKDQPFFAQAKVGDKVLIYTKAQKAILYDPVEKKIVEVAPVNLGDTTAVAALNSQTAGTGSASVTAAEKIQISIKVLNASKTLGLARQVADKLKLAGYTKVTASDASQGARAQTTISYDPKYGSLAADVKQVLNGQGTAQEQAGASGITIVLGTDFTAQ